MKKILQLLICIFVASGARGQITPVTDQYILNPILINPAQTGSRGTLNVAAFYRRQWVGIKGAPETLTLSADAPLSNGKIGLGFSIISNKIGVTKETSVSTAYSYSVKALGGDLSLGLRAGLFGTNTRWSDLIVLDPGDELSLVDSKVYLVPDFSFGMYLSYDHYFAGISIPRLLGYKFNFDKNRYSLKVNPGEYYYLLNTGYVFDIAPGIKFFPSTLVSLSPGNKTLLDINAHFGFSDKLWTGISYRSNKSMAALFQFAVNDQLKFAYSYYLDFSKLGRYSNGSHEVMIRYEFRFKADVVSPLIF